MSIAHPYDLTDSNGQSLSLFFTLRQLELIREPFNPNLLKDRPGGHGRRYDYAEAEVITDLLDHIIGFDRWSFEASYCRELRNTYAGEKGQVNTLTVVAEGALTIHRLPGAPAGPGLVYRRIGANTAEWLDQTSAREACQTAFKSADTDSLKRAASLIGPAFDPRTAAKARDRKQPQKPAQSRGRRESAPANDQRATTGGGRRSAKAYISELTQRLSTASQDERRSILDRERMTIEELPKAAFDALQVMLDPMGLKAA